MVKYTTATIVRGRAKNIAADPTLTDAAINEFIEESECVVNGILGFDLRNEFNDEKHGIVRQVTTDMAVFYAVAFDPSGFASTSEAALVLDIIYTNLLRGVELLKDDRIRKSLKVKT
jgi:NAD(P)H-hydrate repair Nnr-like enzyme with NAD(P)H-hydrate epimerase domain